MGRPSKPTEIKLHQGTARKDRINPNELKLKKIPGLPGLPSRLRGNPEVAELWESTVRTLFELGMLAEAHLPSVAAYCVEMGRYWSSYDKVREEGATKFTPNGYEVVNPNVQIANTSLNNAMKLAAKFGLYPVDAMKINAPGKKDEDGDMFS